MEANELMINQDVQNLTPKILPKIENLNVSTECKSFLRAGLKIALLSGTFTTVDKIMNQPWLKKTQLPLIKPFAGENYVAVTYLTRCGHQIDTNKLWYVLEILF